MSAAFAQIRPESAVPKRVLKTDLEEEDKAFSANLKHFQKGISVANPIVAPKDANKIDQFYPEKNKEIQVQAALEDRRNIKENSTFLQGSMDSAVESNHVETPNGNLDQLPPLATKGVQVSAKDDLLDDFLQPNQKSTPAPSKKATPAKEECPFDDLISSSTAGLIDPFGEDVLVEATKPVPSEKPVPQPSKCELKPEPQKAAIPIASTSQLPMSLLDGFDLEKFSEVQAMISRIMANCSAVDLAHIEKVLPEYAVTLHLDHYRENPRAIDQKMAEVKDKQDSIQAIRRQLIPFVGRLQIASETAEKVGSACSSASNAEKRGSQVRIVCEELFIRYKIAKNLLELAEEEYAHLHSQYEACSRLVTFYTSMHRGELPSTLPPVEKSPVQVNATRSSVVIPEAPPPSEAGKEVAPKVTQSVAELDDFPKAPAQMMPKAEAKGKGSRVVEF